MNSKFKKICLIAFVIMSSLATYAQDPGGDGGDQEQPEPAPINDFIPIALIMGVGIGYILFTKRKVAKQ
jgi:hypothetical protein